MRKRELLHFEWAIIDRCDLRCEYCIDKGVYAQKPAGTEIYRPGVEVDVAKKLVTLAPLADILKVNICAGEPLLARHSALSRHLVDRFADHYFLRAGHHVAGFDDYGVRNATFRVQLFPPNSKLN